MIIFLVLIIISLSFYLIKTKKKLTNKKGLLERFKEKFKNKNVKIDRISQEFINSLLLDPERNISIGNWYSENELREKADIHRARLSKFGKSKNGSMECRKRNNRKSEQGVKRGARCYQPMDTV